MSKISLKLEVQDMYGSVVKAFYKEVETQHTPSKDMLFTGEGYTLEARTVFFNVDDGSVFVRFVEYPSVDGPDSWDFLTKEGWELL